MSVERAIREKAVPAGASCGCGSQRGTQGGGGGGAARRKRVRGTPSHKRSTVQCPTPLLQTAVQPTNDRPAETLQDPCTFPMADAPVRCRGTEGGGGGVSNGGGKRVPKAGPRSCAQRRRCEGLGAHATRSNATSQHKSTGMWSVAVSRTSGAHTP